MDQPNYQKIKAWQKSKNLSLEIYKITSKFPSQEKFGLCSQMQRSAISVPSNIAEGYMRDSVKDFKRFISISLGSLAELDTQLIIAYELGYFSEQEFVSLRERVIEILKCSLFLSVKSPKIFSSSFFSSDYLNSST